MSAFDRHRLKVAIHTTKQAEFDFASWHVPGDTQESIARNLKTMPKSPGDRYFGDIRVRQISGWDVAFLIAPLGNEWVILVISVEPPNESERMFDYALRVGFASLPPFAQEFLKGPKGKEE